MIHPRYRPLLIGALALALVWGLATAGYVAARDSKPTAAKLKAFMVASGFGKLPPAGRAQVIAELERRLAALPPDEWQAWKREEAAQEWYGQMTLFEKAAYMLATAQTAFRGTMGNMHFGDSNDPDDRGPRHRPRRR